ncbi:hypothetical protein [Pantoea dispersa]|uniref:hypothetical protein n=1 Tax=Pantoea dispersa TaxID=59814 RepID=UPI0024AF8085|nr:hypothetical protein [Pantoea dispersa]MDI6637051.1 hypothetical protein [Pantoea dispersa]
MKLRYDLIGAAQCGEKRHPADVLKSLRISYKQYEGMAIADCIFIHDALLTVDYLPNFIDIIDDSPTIQHAFSGSKQMSDYVVARLSEFAGDVDSGKYICKSANADIAGFESLTLTNEIGENFSIRIPERKK